MSSSSLSLPAHPGAQITAHTNPTATTLGRTDSDGPRTQDTAFSSTEPHKLERAHAVLDGVELGPSRKREIWYRFEGKSRERVPSALESARAVLLSSGLNVLLLFIPVAWTAHFLEWNAHVVFALSFVSIIPLERLLDFLGEQLSMYCGKELGDLVMVFLNNTVEATLAVILLTRCELKLLQSTITGVILLHLLLVPGISFIAGGLQVWEQNLQIRRTQLNHTLLTIGILSLLLPAAFFSSLQSPPLSESSTAPAGPDADKLRGSLLAISRGIAVLLLIVYVASRAFLVNPPGRGNALTPAADEDVDVLRLEAQLSEGEPEVNPWVCVGALAVVVALTAVTVEFFVSSIESVREANKIEEAWFGIVLLPLVSFSGDATVAVLFALRKAFWGFTGPPPQLAKALSIDLSIQFVMFWMPFLVMIAWFTHRPLTLLFDLFEVTLLVGACFLVNYVTADGKTNWAEGLTLCSFYVIIGLVAWFYPGQPAIADLLRCGDIAAVLRGGGE